MDRVLLLSSDTLPVDRLKKEFATFYETAEVYLEKWYDFSQTGHWFHIQCFNLKTKREVNYRQLSAAMSALHLENDVDLDELFDENSALQDRLRNLEENSSVGALWAQALGSSRSAFPNYAKLMSFILSIPVSNAYPERVFSIMKGAWTDRRNRCSITLIRSEIKVKMNLGMTCAEFHRFVLGKKGVLAAVKSSAKYGDAPLRYSRL